MYILKIYNITGETTKTNGLNFETSMETSMGKILDKSL